MWKYLPEGRKTAHRSKARDTFVQQLVAVIWCARSGQNGMIYIIYCTIDRRVAGLQVERPVNGTTFCSGGSRHMPTTGLVSWRKLDLSLSLLFHNRREFILKLLAYSLALSYTNRFLPNHLPVTSLPRSFSPNHFRLLPPFFFILFYRYFQVNFKNWNDARSSLSSLFIMRS